MDIAAIATLSKSQGFWLVFVFVMWAELLFGGYAVGRPKSDNEHRMPVWTRLMSSIVLVIAAVLWWNFVRDGDLGAIAGWFVIGMSAGFIGDLFMAQIIPVRRHILNGMIAFSAGHIAYILGMASAAQQFALDDTTLITVAVVAGWIGAVVLWVMLIYRASPIRTYLHYAALVYGLLLATTAAVAIALALQEPRFGLVALGAVLFLVSDIILSLNLFREIVFWRIHDVVWLTYGPGQMLIVLGLAFFALGVSSSLV